MTKKIQPAVWWTRYPQPYAERTHYQLSSVYAHCTLSICTRLYIFLLRICIRLSLLYEIAFALISHTNFHSSQFFIRICIRLVHKPLFIRLICTLHTLRPKRFVVDLVPFSFYTFTDRIFSFFFDFTFFLFQMHLNH